MTPETQRIAIAEACGGLVLWRNGVPYWRDRWEYPESSGTLCRVEFDPLEDLNAMHEAEKVLNNAQNEMFCAVLLYVTCSTESDQYPNLCYPTFAKTMHATAAQRAEAFLRTIGKWQEGGAK